MLSFEPGAAPGISLFSAAARRVLCGDMTKRISFSEILD